MKKILLITSLFVLVANSAFAATMAAGAVTTGGAVAIYGGVDATAALNAPTPLIKTSTGVNGFVAYTATVGTDYLIVTKHTSGSKVFGTCNGVNNIYWRQPSTTGTLTFSMAGSGVTSTSGASSSFVGNGCTSY